MHSKKTNQQEHISSSNIWVKGKMEFRLWSFTIRKRGLISLWLYKENNKLRDWKNVFTLHIPPWAPHTYDFVILTSLTHPRKILLAVLKIGKAKNLSAPLRIHLSRYAPPITRWRDVQYIMYESECDVIKSRLVATWRIICLPFGGYPTRRKSNRVMECKQELQCCRQVGSASRTTAKHLCGTLTCSGLQNGPISSLGVWENWKMYRPPISINIVAYRPVAKQWLCKQRPFLGNGSVNTFPLLGSRFLIMQQLDYNNGNGVFSMWIVPKCYKQWTSLVEFWNGGYEEITWALEAEESPLLEAVAREQLVKTQQAGKKA
jgi:hypothetical protein